MKKIIISLAAIIGCAMLNSCGLGATGASQPAQTQTSSSPTGGDILSSAVNQVAGNSAIGNIISIFAPGITTSKSTIVGTWKYTKPCVQFDSENLLAKAGGSVAATKVESKLESIYQIAGIKPGACTFTFNNDNTMQYVIGGKTLKGTYSFNSSNKTITIKTQAGAQITAYVSVSGSKMGLTFDSSKLLTIAGGAASLMNSSISAIIGSYNGMKLGFEFNK